MSVIVIRYDGDDITADIQLADAQFVSAVNGQIGSANFVVKDAGHTHEFIAGRSLTLDIDGVRTWGGFVIQASKTYAFPVVRTTNPEEVPRLWNIVGVDYNVLFNKRIVWDPAAPTTHTAFNYDADTYDDTIILDIFNNYLDIEDDGLSSSGVERIAKAILDIPGKVHDGTVASAGYTWKQAMDTIASATGGVYCINPNKVLMYVDVEEATSDYTLTDTPSTATDVGYQNFELLENGADMVNDMLLWGSVAGPNQTFVFSRTTDSTSITSHFRWQLGARAMVYRQASADIVADSYVYGTPQSHRGGKDDAISVSCRVFRPLFQAGEVVSIVSDIFGYEDALPLRRMTTTFLSPTVAIFDLWLSHEIDQPNAINEYWWPPFPKPPEYEPSPPGEAKVCYIFDDFNNRVIVPDEVQGDWGYASSGPHWIWGGTGFQNGVADGLGYFSNDSAGGGHFTTTTGLSDSADLFIEMRMWQHHFSGTVFNFGTLEFGVLGPDTISPYSIPTTETNALFINDGLGGYYELEFDYDDLENPISEFLPSMFILQAERVGGTARARIWNEYASQPGWMVSGSVGTGGLGIEKVQLDARPEENGEGDLTIDYIKFCTTGTGIPFEGLVREVLASLTGVDLYTTNAFTAGTPRVWVNGLAQENFSTEPELGRITLSAPLIPEDVVVVQYVANGPPLDTFPSGYFAVPPAGTTVFSGDPTGVNDVSFALQSFLELGGNRALAPDAVYRCDSRIQLENMDDWHLYAQGATINGKGIYSDIPLLKDSVFRVIDCNDFIIEDLNIVGEADLADVTGWTDWDRENEHNFRVDGCTNGVLRRCSGTGAWGDGLYVGSDGGDDNSDRVVIDTCHFGVSGRNNISSTGCRNLRILDCTLTSAGLANYWAGPTNLDEWNYQVQIRRTDFRLTNLGDTPTAYGDGFAMYVSTGDHEASDYFIDACTGDQLDIYLEAPSGYTNTDIVVTHNSSDGAAILSVADTTGLTFAYNTNITQVDV